MAVSQPPVSLVPETKRTRRQFRAAASSWFGFGLTVPLLALLAVMVLVPIIRLISTALGAPDGLSNLKEFFSQGFNGNMLKTTFLSALEVSLASVILGGVIAWSLRTTQSRGMRLVLLAAVFLPFFMGSVIKVYAFTVLFEREGVINRVLIDLHIIAHPLNLIYNDRSVVVAMIYQMIPYAVLPLYVAFSSIDLELIRTAESLGASRYRALRSVVIPLATPGFLAAAIVVYVISLGFYLTPVLLGGGAAPFAASFISQDIFDFYNLSSAAVTALVLLVGGALVIAVGYTVVGRERLERALG